MAKLKLMVLLAILLLAVAFAVQNAEVVDIKFLTWNFSTPRALLVVLLLAAGFVVGYLTSSLAALKSQMKGD